MTVKKLRQLLEFMPDDTPLIIESGYESSKYKYIMARAIPVMIFPGDEYEIDDDDGVNHQDGDIHTPALLIF